MKVSAAIAAAIALHGCGEGEQKAAAPQEQGFMAVGKQLKALQKYDQKKVEALLKNVIKNQEAKKVVKDLKTVIETTISKENRAELHQQLDAISKEYWSTEKLHLAEKEAHLQMDKVVEIFKGISADQLKVKDAAKELKAMQASLEKHAEKVKTEFEGMNFDSVIADASAHLHAALSPYKIEGKDQFLNNLTKTVKQVAHTAVDASKTIDLSKFETQVHAFEEQQLKTIKPEQMFNDAKAQVLPEVSKLQKAMATAEKQLNTQVANFDRKIVKQYESEAVDFVKKSLNQI